MKLFLDDIRQPDEVWRNTIDPDYEQNSAWIVVRSYKDFVSFISEKNINEYYYKLFPCSKINRQLLIQRTLVI